MLCDHVSVLCASECGSGSARVCVCVCARVAFRVRAGNPGKSDLCQCSFSGWCTYWHLLHALQWDLNALAQNCRPTLAHDGTVFAAGTDLQRQSGEEYGFSAPVIQVRGDWPAIAEFFCYRTWAHAVHPCLLCRIGKHQFQDLNCFSNVTVNEAPWELFGLAQHVAEVQRHTVQVQIESPDVRSAVLQVLRHSGYTGGRYVCRDIASLGLRAGDRLDPSVTLQDVHQFEFQTCPFSCVFWRGSKADRITHASPLMAIEGMSLDMYGIDMLHTWALGALQSFVGFALWHVLRCKVLSSGLSWLSVEEDDKIGMIQIKSEMWRYYSARRKTDLAWKAKGSEASMVVIIEHIRWSWCRCNWRSLQWHGNRLGYGVCIVVVLWCVACWCCRMSVLLRCGTCPSKCSAPSTSRA